MAVVQRFNGDVQPGQFFGREVKFFVVTGDISAAAPDAAGLTLFNNLSRFGTVEMIGQQDAPGAGTFRVMMSGCALDAAGLAAATGLTITAFTF
ncbi:MAG: hypothetical protein N2235_01540 [Fischerella sp.]|nr:hypothetical protein [Fischerella sp.]